MIYLYTFLVGGAICTIGQLLINYTRLTPARILIIFLLAGVLLTAVGAYEPIVEFAGAGATVPIVGFGYTLAKGAMEGAKEGILGGLLGGVKAASAGLTAAIVFSFLFAMIFTSKTKKQ
ncbi:MAG: stage V sporulation protein AE [Firmicutes bacterium]|nr:stage V sporulation protein AE [Bacillota bacterium]